MNINEDVLQHWKQQLLKEDKYVHEGHDATCYLDTGELRVWLLRNETKSMIIEVYLNNRWHEIFNE